MNSFVRHLFAATAVFVVAALAWTLYQGHTTSALESSVALGEAAKPGSSPLELRGVNFSTYHEGRLAGRMRAALMTVVPRKVAVFRLRSANEILFHQVRLDSYSRGEQTGGLFSAETMDSTFKGMKGLGHITQIRLEEVAADFHRDDRVTARLTAKRGEINVKNHSIRLKDVRLHDPASGRIIHSSVAFWDESNKIFHIPGDYVVETPRGKANGKAITVTPDFTITSLQQPGGRAGL